MAAGFRLTSEELNTEHYACLARATLRCFHWLAWPPRVEGYDAAFGPNLTPLDVSQPYHVNVTGVQFSRWLYHTH